MLRSDMVPCRDSVEVGVPVCLHEIEELSPARVYFAGKLRGKLCGGASACDILERIQRDVVKTEIT